MYHTTGFTKAQITELCARIEARELSPRVRRWPPIPGLRNALTVTLTYLRRNRVQAEIAENYGVSQPTISRAISAITPLPVQALLDYVRHTLAAAREHIACEAGRTAIRAAACPG
jgi:Helix-turn-helix of DDE superfamily endonuclease